MAEGRSTEMWNHTSSILALVANVNRDPKKGRAFTPADFNPFFEKTSRPDVIVVTKENVSYLKQAFLGEKL